MTRTQGTTAPRRTAPRPDQPRPDQARRDQARRDQARRDEGRRGQGRAPRVAAAPRVTGTGAGRGRPTDVPRSRPATGRPDRQPNRRPPRRRPRTSRLRLGHPNRRFRVALVITLFVLSMFAGRLVQLQGLDATQLAAQALAQLSTRMILPAHRGDIIDARGAVLATTIDQYDLTVDQTVVGCYKRPGCQTGDPAGVAAAAKDLVPILHMDLAALTARLTGTRRWTYVDRNVDPQTWRAAAALQIPSLTGTLVSRRIYPAATVGASVVGFLSRDGKQALAGIEHAYDAQLRGTSGFISYESGMDGAQIPTGSTDTQEPVSGSTVRLTLDQDLQWKAGELITQAVQATGAVSGSVVVMRPSTGEVLALANAPTFDPNDLARARVSDLGDRALLDVFEPGSTAKVITMAAALQEGLATPQTQVVVPGQLYRAGHVFHDAEGHASERLTVAGVLAVSSNIGTVEVGEQVPPRTMYAYQRKFGLGAPTGIGLSESAGILTPAAQWSGTQRYTVLFGQGLSVTAIQAADVFSTLADNGVRVPPRIVAGTTSPDGSWHPTPAPSPVRVVSAATATQMRLMMENVVSENGTAVAATIPGYRVAGKTGTAQYADPTCGCYRGYTASFIGMAPADNPQLVVAVILQRPTKGHFGGAIAAPVFQQLMTYALAEQQIPPTGTKPPTLPLTF